MINKNVQSPAKVMFFTDNEHFCTKKLSTFLLILWLCSLFFLQMPPRAFFIVDDFTLSRAYFRLLLGRFNNHVMVVFGRSRSFLSLASVFQWQVPCALVESLFKST